MTGGGDVPGDGSVTGAALVTGGGNGIGRATVLRFLAEGTPVVIADVNAANAAATARLAAQAGHGDQVAVAEADVRREADVAAAVELARGRFGRLAVMVNNAGVGGAFGPIDTVESADWDYTFEVLVRGVFYGIKHAVPVLRAAGGGSIVNVASAAAFSGGFGPAAYSAAKAAVVNLTRSTATELAPDHIRVNAVCPGAILTAMTDGGRPDQARERLAASQPWPRAGTPEAVADAIVFLAGPRAEFITGESLLVDGGLVGAGPGRDYAVEMRTDPGRRGLSGISYGSTGTDPIVRRRPR